MIASEGAHDLRWWARSVITSTSLFGASYLILYQAAHNYYSHFGITPEQAGVSRDALAGGVLEFAILYAVIFTPGTWMAMGVARWITRAHPAHPEGVVYLLFVLGLLFPTFAVIFNHNRLAVDVLLLLSICFLMAGIVGGVASIYDDARGGLAKWASSVFSWVLARWERTPRTRGGLGFVVAGMYVGREVVQRLRRWVWAWRIPRVRRVRVRWVGTGVFVVLVIWLWVAADLAGQDVVRRGGSNQSVLAWPVFELLGLRTTPISPCLIDFHSDKTQPPSHLRAAVIVGQSGGRTYLVGVAGSPGFRGVPVGHVSRFSVADSELRAVDLDRGKATLDASNRSISTDKLVIGSSPTWDTSAGSIPADKLECPPTS